MDVLLTALGIALQRWTGQDSSLITLEGHGRDWPGNALDLTRTVGWFTSLFPFELAVPGQNVGQKLLHLKDRLRSIPNKGIGYGLLRYVAGQQTGWDPSAGPKSASITLASSSTWASAGTDSSFPASRRDLRLIPI
jgi:hypothetical protein